MSQSTSYKSFLNIMWLKTMWALIATQTLFQHPMLLLLTILWPWLHLLDYNFLTCKTGTRKLTLQGYRWRQWGILKCLSNNWIYYIHLYICYLHILYHLLYNITDIFIYYIIYIKYSDHAFKHKCKQLSLLTY